MDIPIRHQLRELARTLQIVVCVPWQPEEQERTEALRHLLCVGHTDSRRQNYTEVPMTTTRAHVHDGGYEQRIECHSLAPQLRADGLDDRSCDSRHSVVGNNQE